MKQEDVTFNTDKYLSVFTHGGVRQITPEMWAQAMTAYKPDMCALMADIVTDNDAKMKRIKRSVDRSLRWLDTILPKAKEIGVPVFAPVVGHTSEEERARSAVSTGERDVDGFTVNVVGLGGLGNETILKLAKASLNNLPKEKPRIVYGFGTPESILDAVSSGADLFDGSYAYKVTEQGRAMSFKFGEIAGDNTDRDKPKTINLWDPSMSHSFEPLDKTCGCYACSASHTKAYIHHLLNAHEMLGPILLMSHNIYQLDNFMASIRKSIDENRFESDLAKFMEYYNHVEEGDGMRDHQDEIDVESLGTPLKKKRTLLL
ncbi:tRNA-guanine(15) transglycosylase-like protein [Phycomyces nitens]|nr:tRNA-guanine(15) transglycosylase-like protein [Phycomyces nitens]